jgi:hypothetical protein
MFIKADNQIQVAILNQVWTGEWDLSDDSIHNPLACTIKTREEAYRNVLHFCEQNPEYLFLVFDTPGGVRAFCVSHSFNPSDWESFRLHSVLNCDPFFQELTWKGKAYTARVTPKQKRVEATGHDYISRKKYVIGTGIADTSLTKEVEDYYKVVEQNRV